MQLSDEFIFQLFLTFCIQTAASRCCVTASVWAGFSQYGATTLGLQQEAN